ncbi:FMN-dependent NADH-azoreductase [Desulfuromusa kysingii]|uniref:FMN dependent NADH:quinone oxidoreductase n=1 Tax=Desulfuromusa kysingii TaxID=37625 RepID=A0A1H4E4Y1_9BACT|nr:FMN-dependent NADH-azoreductase [Desulfuromusa kysingii]SEA80063.1 FMN-dependent NADH-azoreductase [Desulfuromusa kysingii]
MKNILVFNSSVLAENSVSRVLVAKTVAALLVKNPGAQIIEHDLGCDPIPHLDTATVAGIRGVPESEAEDAARARSDELVAELQAADVLVVGSPMYNFSIPTGLRSWFDYVLRPGVTFQYTASGPQGLLADKRVIVIESRGGFYSAGPAQSRDFQEPYLRALFAFMGLQDLTFIRAEKIGSGAEARAAAIENAEKTITSVV